MTRGRKIAWTLALALAGPILLSAAQVATQEASHWSRARWDSAGIAPDPKQTREAVVQVYSARVWGWRGALAVHTWFALKPEGSDRWTRAEVTGFGVRYGAESLRITDGAVADGRWAGNDPQLLLDRRGPEAAKLIPEILAAANRYPYRDAYVMWPGPNSNSFTAFVAREVPDLRLEMPPTAIGKDWIGQGDLVGPAPSGSGMQLSIFGLVGFTLAPVEGVELNLLGLTLGVDVMRPALKLPGVGRVGMTAS